MPKGNKKKTTKKKASKKATTKKKTTKKKVSEKNLTSKPLQLVSVHASSTEKTIDAPRSKTWRFKIDPIIFTTSAGQMYRLDTILFTIFEDVAAKYIMQWNATALGWRSIQPPYAPPVNIHVEIGNDAGVILDKWDIGPLTFNCGAYPVQFQSQGLMGVIDLATKIRFAIGATEWTRCLGA